MTETIKVSVRSSIRRLKASKTINQLYYVGTLVFFVVVTTMRLSIGALLLRITTNRKYRLIIWATLLVSTISCVVSCLYSAFQCSPVDYLWTRLEHPKKSSHCVGMENTLRVMYAQAAISVVVDWVLSALPAAIIWNFKVATRHKLAVIATLGVGIV